MAKTKKELEAHGKKAKVSAAELTDDELKAVTGGSTVPELIPPKGSGLDQDDYEVSWKVEPGENHGTAPLEPGEYSVVITGKGR